MLFLNSVENKKKSCYNLKVNIKYKSQWPGEEDKGLWEQIHAARQEILPGITGIEKER